LTLPLANTGSTDQRVSVEIRQAHHLRDFGSRDAAGGAVLATLSTSLPAGAMEATFTPETPIACEPGRPVVIVIGAMPEVTWAVSWQEPPGTQAARWDDELGYWRWQHGTLGFTLDPVSRPFGPESVLSGVTRPEESANLWISDPSQPLPQALELAWPDPVDIARVELTFDSQLSGWLWEGAFPTIPTDYEIAIQASPDSEWQAVASITGNVQRHRIHTFATHRAARLRITIRATNGGKTARIVEVRAYAAGT
ncbi:MAG: hypothetical protein WBA46_08980, partial [Thermomicrobiales bacterium]